MTTQTWFDRLYEEFHSQGLVMFAFSQKQVEDKGVAWDDFQAGWRSYGAGLHVKATAWDEFVRRMEADLAADQATLPELRVRHIGTDYWDRHLYVDASGRRLADASLSPAGEAIELHTLTDEGEPISAVRARVVFVEEF